MSLTTLYLGEISCSDRQQRRYEKLIVFPKTQFTEMDRNAREVQVTIHVQLLFGVVDLMFSREETPAFKR